MTATKHGLESRWGHHGVLIMFEGFVFEFARRARRGPANARRDLSWFTERFNTCDLKEAKALLDELSQ